MKKSTLLASFVLLCSMSSFAGGSDVGSSESPEYLIDCMSPNLGDFSKEEANTELLIFKAMALNSKTLVWKETILGRTASLVRIHSGNDYSDLYFVVVDNQTQQVEHISKFKYSFTQLTFKGKVRHDDRYQTLKLRLAEPKSVEAKATKVFDLEINLDFDRMDSDKCLRTIK